MSPQDLRSLRAIAEENRLKRCLCVSLEPRRREAYGITILPYREFIDALWNGEFSG